MPESSPSEQGQSSNVAKRLNSASWVRRGGNSIESSSTSSIGGTLVQNNNRLSNRYYDIASTILAGGLDIDELFLAAARDGEYEKIEQFLHGRSDVIVSIDTKDKRTGNTPLIWAAKKAHTKIVQLLLKHGADPTLRNYEGQTAIEVATPGIKTILLDSVEKTTESSHRLLLQAAWQGNIKIVRKLLTENKVLDINCQNAEGLTPLLLVTRDIQLFERLSLQLNRPYNPLEVIQELLANRANIHASDGDDKTCLHHVSSSRATLAQPMVDVLIREGSELELRDRRHFMPIHLASHSGNTKVVVTLLDGGSEVNSRGFAGLTPLHITAHKDHSKTAHALIEHGADVTLPDDRGLTAVDLAKTKRMKTMLKEAWSEQSQKKQPASLAPVRAPSRDESKKGFEKNRKGEVIFDGLVSTPLQSKTGPTARPSFPRSISNAEKAKQAEQQMQRDFESGRFTPSIRDNTRRLGTVRQSQKSTSTTLPRVQTASSGTPSSPDRLSPGPESPRGRKSSLGEYDLRHSMEDGRGRAVGVRRSKSLKLSQSPSERRQITPMSTRDEEFCVQNNRVSPVPNEMTANRRTHRRTGSDPFVPPKLGDVALSCDTYLPRRGRSLSNSEEYDDERGRLTPLRTPLDREVTGLNIPTTIHEVLTPRSSAHTVIVNQEERRTPPQLISLYPNSSNVLPSTPTFITQRAYSILDARLMEFTRDGDSSKECSPRSDDEALGRPSQEQVRLAMSNPTELLRSRSLLKEEFVLDESRPKDPLLQSSGSDPTSSASSLSSSPRESNHGNVNILILNKVQKNSKEHQSPLSKVGRYSISGPNNNVGERFRNKVSRSRSFSSGPVVSGDSKLQGARKPVKQVSVDVATSRDENHNIDVRGKNVSEDDTQCGTISGKTDSKSQNSGQSIATSASENNSNVKHGVPRSNSSQTLKKSQSLPGALNAASFVKSPLLNTSKPVAKTNSAISSKMSGTKCSSSELKSLNCDNKPSVPSVKAIDKIIYNVSVSQSAATTKPSHDIQPPSAPSKEDTQASSSSKSNLKVTATSSSTVSKTLSNQMKLNSAAPQPKQSSQKPAIAASKVAASAKSSSTAVVSSRPLSSATVSLSRVSLKVPTTPLSPASRSQSDSQSKPSPAKQNSAGFSPVQQNPDSAKRIILSSTAQSKTNSSNPTSSPIKTKPNSAKTETTSSTPSKPSSAKQNMKVSFATNTKTSTAVKVLPTNVPKSDVTRSLRSPSDSRLGSRPNSSRRSNPAGKSDDTWRYVKPCQGNKEPLVRISLPGEEPKPHIYEPGVNPCVVMQTPVIVNPFENWVQQEIIISPRTLNDGVENHKSSFVVGKSSKDATCKMKKTRNVKSAKKKDGKRPISGGRQNSGKRRGAKSQESKPGDESEGRVKSGKGKRIKSARKRKKTLQSEGLLENASKPDIALISGIGWHLATGCNDTSDVLVADMLFSSDSEDSDIEVIDPDAPKFKLLSARTEGTVSPSTPRFQEIKVGNEKLPLPVMTHDGFPPMNLDMTQNIPEVRVSGQQEFENASDEEDYSNHLNDVTNALHMEIMLGKLTPIPEAPSMPNSVQAAINRFDQTVKEDQLNKMLGIIAGESLSSQQAQAIRQSRQEGVCSADSRLRKSGSFRKEVLVHESVKARKAASQKVEVTSAKKVSQTGSKKPKISLQKARTTNKDSLAKESDLISRQSSGKSDTSTDDENIFDRKERKFSESKNEEEIDEAIEEILNATGNSLSSTLRSNNTIRSQHSTLTEGDRNILKRLQNSGSMFHAKTSEDDHIGPSGETVRQSDTYHDDTNPNLLKVFHAENFNMGSKVKAMIDAGADKSKVKAMLDVDEEAKHLAKVMNSFRHMELHAGSGSVRGTKDTPRKHSSVPRPEQSLEGPLMTRKPPSGRPSSGGRFKGKFHEMKSRQSETYEAGTVSEELDVLEKLSAAVAGEMTDPNTSAMISHTSDGETLCSHISGRRGSRTGSACTEDSLSSAADETIQWKKGNILGKGAFGTVWCGLTNEGVLIAVKQIELNTADIEKAHREYEKVQEEVELLKNLRHKNIVGYMGTSFEDYTVSIFMHLVPGGSIASILARFGALEESVFRHYTRQILKGVEYLHDNDVIHRDIKGGNVMLMPNGIIKLIDFGCAKRLCINLSMSQSQILKSMKGTPYWMAPEVVKETGHGKKSDIWSIGCTVFEMATRKPPWSDMNPMAAIFAIGSDRPVPTLPADKFSEEAQSFVKKCMTRDQNVRPSATELLQDSFMTKKVSRK